MISVMSLMVEVERVLQNDVCTYNHKLDVREDITRRGSGLDISGHGVRVQVVMDSKRTEL